MKINNPKEFKNEVDKLLDEYILYSRGLDYNSKNFENNTSFGYVEEKEANEYLERNIDEIVNGINEVEKYFYFDDTSHGYFGRFVKTRIMAYQRIIDFVEGEKWFQNCNDLLKFVIKFALLVKIVEYKHPYMTSLWNKKTGDVKFHCSLKFTIIDLIDGSFESIFDTLSKFIGPPLTKIEYVKKFKQEFLKNLKLSNKIPSNIFKLSFDIFTNNVNVEEGTGKNITLGSETHWKDFDNSRI